MIKTRVNSLGPALAAALLVGIAGCGDTLGVEGGSVRFVLSSSPETTAIVDGSQQSAVAAPDLSEGPDEGFGRFNRYFVSANVTFSSILARNLDGVLVDVNIELPATVDVMTMEGGREITLPDGDLPPATYDQIVVVMTEVEGVTHDGTTVAITPPGGGWTAIVPICPFTVEDGATAVVGLELSVQRSFMWRGNRFHFEPRFKCEQADEDDEEPVS